MRASTKILTALTLTLFACPAFADTAPKHGRNAAIGDWRL
jgi:hypothetical protein